MIVDGKQIAEQLEKNFFTRLVEMPQKKVCFVLFGNDPASIQFIKIKTKVADRLGIKTTLVTAPQDITNNDALELMDQILKDDYDGVVIQLPTPSQLESDSLLHKIPNDKDIDVLAGSSKNAPVAQAVLEIFNFYNIDLENKHILIVGNGKLVGKPVAKMLHNKGIKYDSIDKDTGQKVRLEKIASADIIISGVGIPAMITPDMVKQGVILIDAGTSEQSGKLVGDIDPLCAKKASLITPVPGGVGPITVVSLFANLL